MLSIFRFKPHRRFQKKAPPRRRSSAARLLSISDPISSFEEGQRRRRQSLTHTHPGSRNKRRSTLLTVVDFGVTQPTTVSWCFDETCWSWLLISHEQGHGNSSSSSGASSAVNVPQIMVSLEPTGLAAIASSADTCDSGQEAQRPKKSSLKSQADGPRSKIMAVTG